MKKIMMLLLAILAISTLTGCGSILSEKSEVTICEVNSELVPCCEITMKN